MSYLVPRGKQLRKRYTVFLFFIGISTIFHCIFLGLLFFVYHYDTVLAHITLHKDMPIIKFAPQQLQAAKAAMQSQPLVAANTKATKAQSIASPVSKPEPIKEEIKEDKPKGTRAALISQDSEKKTQKKSTQKKNKEIKKQKVETKSKAPVKEKVKEEKPAKELLAQNKITEQKPIEQKEAPTSVKEPEKNQIVAQNDQLIATGSEIAQDVIFAIGEAIEDPKLIQYYTQLQLAVSDAWKPPVGISDECVCDVLIQLDAQGKPKEVKVVKSSGVLIYDLAARNALQEAKMPKWAFGKSITVSFKQ